MTAIPYEFYLDNPEAGRRCPHTYPRHIHAYGVSKGMDFGIPFLRKQTVFAAGLSFNNSVKVVLMGSYMHLKYPDKLESAFPVYT
jgi:hypothetical protein